MADPRETRVLLEHAEDPALRTIEGYRRVLADGGLDLIDFHKDTGENGYYLAVKSA